MTNFSHLCQRHVTEDQLVDCSDGWKVLFHAVPELRIQMFVREDCASDGCRSDNQADQSLSTAEREEND